MFKNPESKDTEEFLCDAKKAAQLIQETLQTDGFIHIFSHLDADGIAAAAVIGKALFRQDARFRIRITQWVDEKITSEIRSDKPDLVILTDFGSGYIDLLNEQLPEQKIVILDHHQTVATEIQNLNHIQVNPHLRNMDGATDASGSSVTYLVARELSSKNTDLSTIAIVGALGDMQDRYNQRQLGGLNSIIVQDALARNQLKVEKDLTFFGRETRPIHRTLSSTTNPFLPGISGEEDKALAFLSSLNIPLKEGDRMRALSDLTETEKRRLSSALAEHLLSKGLHYEVTNLIGHVYTLTLEEPSTPLRDAREFAVLLNSTGRLGRSSLGIAVCMGDRKLALQEANQVLEDYRKSINKYLNWVWEKPERLQELENIYLVNGEDFVNEKIIGTISSILINSLQNPSKPLVAYANVPQEGLAKISSRTTDVAVHKGINLGVLMRLAAEPLGGKGGGHNIAAGGQVPIDKVNDFVRMANELAGKQVRGEDIEGNYNA